MLSIFWLTGLFVCIYIAYKWLTKQRNYFKEMGVAYIEPKLLFGNTGSIFTKRHSMPEYLQILYNKFPNERSFGLFELRQPILIIRDPELIKSITVTDFDHFEDHSSFIDERTDRLFGNSLIMLKGRKWREMRATLSPSFTGSKMRLMFEMIADCADLTTDYLLKQSEKQNNKISWEMKDLFARYTNDVIASCAFGIKVNSMIDITNAFYQNGQEVQKFTGTKFMLKLGLFKLFPQLMHWLNIRLMGKKVYEFFYSMVLDTMEVRKKENIYRPDMINILMQVRKEADEATTPSDTNQEVVPVKRVWTDDDIVAQCFVFYLAGFDSSAVLLSFLSYELAINPEIQQTLYKEVHEIDKDLTGNPIQYETLQKMKYLDHVVQETLRKWPSAVLTDRICEKDYKCNDGAGKPITIKKGTNIWFPIFAIHRDPKYYPNPEKFDPDRFSDENKVNILPGTFLPFGLGPRNCIGSRFALMQIKLIIYKLILNFTLEPNRNTQIPVQFAKTLVGVATEKGIQLDLRRRIVN